MCLGTLAGGQRVGDDDDHNGDDDDDDGGDDDDDGGDDDDDDGELRGQTGWWNPDQRPQTSFALHCQCNNRLNIDIIFIIIIIIIIVVVVVVIIVTLHCNDVKPWWTVIVLHKHLNVLNIVIMFHSHRDDDLSDTNHPLLFQVKI